MKAWNKTMDLQQIFALEVAHLANFWQIFGEEEEKRMG